MTNNDAFKFCLGPVHPALEEPIFFDFDIKGEKVVGARFKAGNVHRGIEYLGMQRNPVQTIYLAEKICGICSVSHPCAFVQAVESAAGIEVPDRAEYIRTIMCELERIHSHILWAGLLAHEIGFHSVLHYGMKIRENVMVLLEIISGNRVNYGMFQIGGVRRDITKEKAEKAIESLKFYKGAYAKVLDVFLNDRTIKARTAGVGVLKKKDAIELCAVGPVARASGVLRDIRQDWPYCAYADLNVKAIGAKSVRGKVYGDVLDKAIVRLLELKQSIEIIEACIDQMPSGPLLTIPKTPAILAKLKMAKGQSVGKHEAPRGETHHYVKLEEKSNVDTWKVRAPTYNNLQTVPTMVSGEQIADIPVIVCSIDPCISCTDRISVMKNTKLDILTKDQLHALSVKRTKQFGEIKHYKF